MFSSLPGIGDPQPMTPSPYRRLRVAPGQRQQGSLMAQAANANQVGRANGLGLGLYNPNNPNYQAGATPPPLPGQGTPAFLGGGQVPVDGGVGGPEGPPTPAPPGGGFAAFAPQAGAQAGQFDPQKMQQMMAALLLRTQMR